MIKKQDEKQLNEIIKQHSPTKYCKNCIYFRHYDGRKDKEIIGCCKLLYLKDNIPISVTPDDYCSFATTKQDIIEMHKKK